MEAVISATCAAVPSVWSSRCGRSSCARSSRTAKVCTAESPQPSSRAMGCMKVAGGSSVESVETTACALRARPDHSATSAAPRRAADGARRATADDAPADDDVPPTRALKLLLVAFVTKQLDTNALRFKIESAADTGALREAAQILFDVLVVAAEHAMAQAAIAQQQAQAKIKAGAVAVSAAAAAAAAAA